MLFRIFMIVALFFCGSASATSISVTYIGTFEGSWSGNYPPGQVGIGQGGGGLLGYGWFTLTFNFDTSLAKPGFFTSSYLGNFTNTYYGDPSVGSAFLSPFGLTLGSFAASDTAEQGRTSQFASELYHGKGGFAQSPSIGMYAYDPTIPGSILVPFKLSSSQPIGSGQYFSWYESNGYGGGYVDYELTPYSIDVVVDGVSAVPEPATWAMFLLGFCGLGLLLHRQRADA